MCGIYGMLSGFLSENERNAFSDLACLSHFRGYDSTGAVVFKNDYQKSKGDGGRIVYAVQKDAIDPFAFVTSDRMKNLYSGNPFLLIGHTRSATRGEVTADNAHPFVFPNVIGVHNGTLEGNYPHKAEYDTDSEALYRLINDVGIEEALKELEATTFPAYSLVYYDRVENSLNFIRNYKRPMSLAWNTSEGTLFFNSELVFLEVALARRNIRFSERSGYTPFSTTPGVLYSFKINETRAQEKWTERKFDFIKDFNQQPTYADCKVTYHTPAKGGTQHTSDPFWPQEPKSTRGTLSGTKALSKREKKERRRKNVTIKNHGFSLVETVTGYFETKSAVQKHLDNGCAFCQKTSDFQDFEANKLIFLDRTGAYLCDSCSEDSDVINQVMFNPGTNVYN